MPRPIDHLGSDKRGRIGATAFRALTAGVAVGLLGLAAVLVGCTALGHVELGPPETYSLVREQLSIHTDFPLAAQHRLIEELAAKRYDLSRELALPVSNEPIHVYLFDKEPRFRAFIAANHPDFPPRRAFFIETDTRLLIYAYWGDRVAEDLRHETTHGYLHAMVPNLPLWLDEGLAEYFEVPRGRNGMNRPHLQRLVDRLDEGPWRPRLSRLDAMTSSFAMTRDDYAEAWAWTHFLLHSHPAHRALLRAYLDTLRREGAAEPIPARLARLLSRPEDALVGHLRLVADNQLRPRPRMFSPPE